MTLEAYDPGATGSGSLRSPRADSSRGRLCRVSLSSAPSGRTMSAPGNRVCSDATMPLPIAVPLCVRNRSIAAATSSRLNVGACASWAVPA